MIADDDASSRRLLELLILKMGHKVLFAEDGQECIDLIEREAVDILLLDINMPKKDGFGVLEHLNDLKIQTPVIMVTASDEIPTVVRCIRMGACEYITKPIDKENLRIAVNGAIKEHEIQRVIRSING